MKKMLQKFIVSTLIMILLMNPLCAMAVDSNDVTKTQQNETNKGNNVDTMPPMIDEIILEQNGQIVSQKDTLKFSVRAHDIESGIKSIQVTLGFSGNSGFGDNITLTQNTSDPNLYEGEYSLESMPAHINFGYIKSIIAIDNTGNKVVFNDTVAPTGEYMYFVKLTTSDFADFRPPVIDYIILEQNEQTVFQKDTLKFSVAAHDIESDIKSVQVTLGFSGNLIGFEDSITLTQNTSDYMLYEGEYSLESIPSGINFGYIESIIATDNAGNEFTFDNIVTPTGEYKYFVKITTLDGSDTMPPVIDDIILEQNRQTVSQKDTLKFSVRAHDIKSGIKSITAVLTFSGEFSGYGDGITLTQNTSDPNLYEGEYSLESIPSDINLGYIKSIIATDNAGNKFTFDDTVTPGGEYKYFVKINVDTMPPVIDNIILEQNGQTVSQKDTLKFSVRAHDIESGIKSIQVALAFRGNLIGSGDCVTLTQNTSDPNLYEGEYSLELTSLRINLVNIEFIIATDNAGNKVIFDDTVTPTGEYMYFVNLTTSEVSDTIPPVIDDIILEQNGQIVSQKDTLKFSVRAHDIESGIKSIQVALGFSGNTGFGDSITLTQNTSDPNLYEGEYSLESMPSHINFGYIKSITAIDNIGNKVVFKDTFTPTGEYMYFVKLTTSYFADFRPPVIDYIILGQNGQTVSQKDSLKFSVAAHDTESDIKSIQVTLGFSGNLIGFGDSITLTQNTSDSMLYEGEYSLESIPSRINFGYIESIIATDNAGNEFTFDNIVTPTGEYKYFVKIISVEKPDVANKTALSDAVAKAEEKANMTDKYTEESIANLNAVLTEAKVLLSDSNVSQDMVDEMVRKLNITMNGMVELSGKPEKPEVTDKSTLIDAIAKAEKEASLTDKYTKESISNLKSVIKEAKALLDNENSVQTDVDAMVTKVNEAVKDLVLVKPVQKPEVIDKAALTGAVAKAEKEASLTDKYTEESIANLESVIKEAKTLLDKEDVVQADVDAMVTKVNKAVKDLVLIKPVLKPDNNKNPFTDDNKPASTDKKPIDQTTTPKTGDPASTAMLAILLAGSSSAIASILKKKNN